jgi:hypothetical protein
MKSDRPDKVAMSSQREDACRSTAIRVQQPQLGVFVIAATPHQASCAVQFEKSWWMKMESILMCIQIRTNPEMPFISAGTRAQQTG